MHGLVHEFALQVYKNICNNIFKLGNLLHSTQELGRFFFRIVSSQTTSYIAQMQYMYDFLQTLFHTAILGGEGTVMKISMKCNRCDLFQTIVVVFVALLFYVHGKHLRSCRDGQLT